ncbi:murein biosynthesis integral membrane protein MurJ [Candidatus Woesebacteria bacterium GWA1_41_8]|jgi:putative peptidoglycan lipid II flippase|uniref:Probable lipid II flippase MurJ n=1 Tax=Candidatus Woesebacteria bacterium GWA1_41_8 TaxID=1802471 RepID=A0A1F7WJR6_9BACT|nr:MAG: murein biosynthesis integral membrane protein MurJ [Candidatus Woesebacteria bacterium GWA1_41_8]
MVNKILNRGKKLLTDPQNSVLSAASVIMLMIVASRVLGLVRQRVLANYFYPEELSLFFAAFRLPDIIFEVLVAGSFSSAFIPVFTKFLKKGTADAWEVAGRVVNIGLLTFGLFALFFGLFANQIYAVLTPGFTSYEITQTATIARVLFAAQGIFVISYVMTGVLESLRRFLVPALAPVLYNLGIILGTIFLKPYFGLMAPAMGVVIGAAFHFLIQLPLAYKLGFRFSFNIKPNDGVKKIGKLALPRVVDLSFDQIGKTIELFLASFISTASYTYYIFANSLQLLPVSLFGTSLAKAALPILSRNNDNPKRFRQILVTTIFQVIFLTAPFTVLLIVLRIPIVRLVYGTNIFDWNATVQTGMVLSAFAVGIVFQTLMAIIGRAFFALHDTKTPVIVSMIGLLLLIIGDVFLVWFLHMPVWALSASFSFSAFIEALLLIYLINRRIGRLMTKKTLVRFAKIAVSALSSGIVMFFFLKFFDRYTWIKRISFLSKIESTKNIPFQLFVLDTRYTINLLILTSIVTVVGLGVYFLSLIIFKSEEIGILTGQLKGLLGKSGVSGIAKGEQETVIPPPTDGI